MLMCISGTQGREDARGCSRVPRKAELEQRLDRTHELVPLLLRHHVFLNVHLDFISIVTGRIRRPDVTNEQATRALKLASHFVREELISKLNARIGPN